MLAMRFGRMFDRWSRVNRPAQTLVTPRVGAQCSRTMTTRLSSSLARVLRRSESRFGRSWMVASGLAVVSPRTVSGRDRGLQGRARTGSLEADRVLLGGAGWGVVSWGVLEQRTHRYGDESERSFPGTMAVAKEAIAVPREQRVRPFRESASQPAACVRPQ
jgi:hypothetical protein